MQLDELITRVSRLPPSKQQEVHDFVAFLEKRYATKKQSSPTSWTEQDFNAMSIDQAMRDIEDEPELYSLEDVQEQWQ